MNLETAEAPNLTMVYQMIDSLPESKQEVFPVMPPKPEGIDVPLQVDPIELDKVETSLKMDKFAINLPQYDPEERHTPRIPEKSVQEVPDKVPEKVDVPDKPQQTIESSDSEEPDVTSVKYELVKRRIKKRPKKKAKPPATEMIPQLKNTCKMPNTCEELLQIRDVPIPPVTLMASPSPR